MYLIAKAQIGLTGEHFGFTEAWCSDFVSDCAILAGQTAAVKGDSYSGDLFNNVIAAGGQDVNNFAEAKRGDLIFFNWHDGGVDWDHVEIVSEIVNGDIYSIGGNTGKKGGAKYNVVSASRKCGTPFHIARPNYDGTLEPLKNDDELGIPYPRPTGSPLIQIGSKGNSVGWVQFALKKLGYDIGSTGVDCDFGAATAAAVKAFQSDNGLEVDGQVGPETIAKIVSLLTPAKVWYASLTPQDLGADFFAYIINRKPWMHLQNTDGNVAIYKETGAAQQIWRFVRNSDGSYKIINCLDSTCLDVYNRDATSGVNVQTWSANDSTAQKWFIYGTSGDYVLRAACTDCVLDVTGGASAEGTNVEMFTKNGSAAQQFQIWKLTQELTVEPGGKSAPTAFSWKALTKKDIKYDLKIWQGTLWDGDPYQINWSLTDTADSVVLPKGHYEAYVDTRIGKEMQMSNVVKFDITEDYVAKPAASILTADKSEAYTGEKITFTAESDTAEKYTIGVDLNGKRLVTEEMPGGKLTLSFEEAGEYTAYVTSYNASGYTDSEKISFTVKEYALNLKETEKHTILIAEDGMTYKSSNTDVAVVSKSGVITAIGEGDAVITVINSDFDTVLIRVHVGNTEETPELLAGDVDADGTVNIADAVLLARFLAEDMDITVSTEGKLNAELDGVEGITAEDNSILLMMLANLI